MQGIFSTLVAGARSSKRGASRSLLLIGLIVSLAITAGSAGFAFYTFNRINNPVGLVATSDAISFGTVRWGIHDREFELSNTMERSVFIERVSTNCDCSKVLIPQGEVMPGERVKGTVQWDTRGKRDETTSLFHVLYSVGNAAGKQSQMRHATISLSAEVRADFDFEPKQIVFVAEEGSEFAKPPASNVVFNVDSSAKNSDRFQILDARVTNPAFVATVADDKRRLTVTFTPNHSPSDFVVPPFGISAEVVIMTTIRQHPTVRIPIKVKPMERELSVLVSRQ